MRFYNILSALALSLLVASCYQDEVAEEWSQSEADSENPYFVSAEEAKTNVLNFCQAFKNSGNLTRSNAETSIDEVILLDAPASLSTRADAESSSPFLYVMNFSDGGFALASADSRTAPVIGITESGRFDKNKISPEYEWFLDEVYAKTAPKDTAVTREEMAEAARQRYANYYVRTMTTHYGPYLLTRWSQGSGFGRFCPNLVPGCVPIAAAQICAYFRSPSYTSWTSGSESGSAMLDWDSILYYSQLYSPDNAEQNNYMVFGNTFLSYSLNTPVYQAQNAVAHLIRQMGVEMHASYGTDTGVTLSNARSWLSGKGYTISSNYSFSNSRSINALSAGKILFTLASGHAWLIDGYACFTSAGYGTEHMFHCNFGWGDNSDGWYIGGCFDSDEKVFDNDLENLTPAETSGTYSSVRFFTVSR